MPLALTTNGTTLFFETFGNPQHAPLLLIQGLSAQMIGWRAEFCSRLTALGYFVIRFDNRDVGLSQKFPDVEYTLTDMAEDVAGLLQSLNIISAHIVGQSMGGMIAQEVAILYPSVPRSLTLLYTATSAEWIFPEALERPIAEPARNEAEAVANYVANEGPCASPGYPQDVAWLKTLGAQAYKRDSSQDGATRQAQAILRTRSRDEALKDISIPTVVITGDGDRLIDPAASVVLHETIPGSTLHVLPGMGHEIPLPLMTTIAVAIHENALRA